MQNAANRPLARWRLAACVLTALPGWAAVAAPEPPAAPAGGWKAAGALTIGRYAPAAVLLPDGRALVAGGYSFERRRTHVSSEVFDPAGDRWSAGPSMTGDRNFPVALPLPGGNFLFIDGFAGRTGSLATTERLDSGRLTFRPGTAASEERELFAATQLQDGRFLITGGYSTAQRHTLRTAEIYDPRTDRFEALPARLHFPRFGHTGVLLPDGRVLLVGGKLEETNEDVRPTELFDPRRRTFSISGALAVGRDRCTAWTLPGVTLADGTVRTRVLIAGGSAQEGGTIPARRCELYDVRTGTLEPGPDLLRDRMAHTATALGDGRVLLAGGWCGSENRTTPVAELWDPRAGRFLPAGEQQAGRHDHAAVLLRDGRVLIAGGKEAPARNGVESPLLTEIWTSR